MTATVGLLCIIFIIILFTTADLHIINIKLSTHVHTHTHTPVLSIETTKLQSKRLIPEDNLGHCTIQSKSTECIEQLGDIVSLILQGIILINKFRQKKCSYWQNIFILYRRFFFQLCSGLFINMLFALLTIKSSIVSLKYCLAVEAVY
jgi:hypothetical protein